MYNWAVNDKYMKVSRTIIIFFHMVNSDWFMQIWWLYWIFIIIVHGLIIDDQISVQADTQKKAEEQRKTNIEKRK